MGVWHRLPIILSGHRILMTTVAAQRCKALPAAQQWHLLQLAGLVPGRQPATVTNVYALDLRSRAVRLVNRRVATSETPTPLTSAALRIRLVARISRITELCVPVIITLTRGATVVTTAMANMQIRYADALKLMLAVIDRRRRRYSVHRRRRSYPVLVRSSPCRRPPVRSRRRQDSYEHCEVQIQIVILHNLERDHEHERERERKQARGC